MPKVAELLRQPWFCAVLLILAVLVVYWPVAVGGFQFVDFDDQQYITDNAIVKQGLTDDGIRWAFTTFTASNWHPLTWLSHMLDCTLFGLRPGWHHAINVLLHAINTVLVFLVLRRATTSHWASLAVAALFGLHPLHVESVAWVAERKDVLSTLFGLLAIGTYVRWVQFGEAPATKPPKGSKVLTAPRRGLAGYLIVMAWFALSLLAKPMFVTLPFILLLMDWWPLRRTDRERWTTLVIEKLPLVALTIGSCVMTVLAQRTKGAIASTDLWPLAKRIETATLAAASYVWNLVWPTDLACIYPHPREWEPWRLPLSILTLLVITIVVAVLWRRRVYLMGWLLFLGTLVPVIGLVQVGAQWKADRYTYLPALGVFIMVAWGVAVMIERQAWRRGVAIVSGLAILALAIAAHQQVWTWRDSRTLFTHAAEVVPNNHVAHNSLAAALTKAGEDVAAAEHVRAAASIHPNYLQQNDFVGKILLEADRLPAALAHYTMLTELIPKSAALRSNLGSVRYRLHDLEGAQRDWTMAISIDPQYAGARRNLGSLLMQRGELDAAAAEYQRSLQDEEHADAHANLGAIRLQQNQMDAAVAELQKAVMLDPSVVEARVSLGVAMARLGRWDDAIAQLSEALRLKPDHPQARMLLDAARQQRQAGRTP